MADPRVDKLAHLVVNYSVGVHKGDWVMIWSDVEATPLVNAVVREVLRAGAHPEVLLGVDEIQETVLRESSDEQLEWTSPANVLRGEKVNCLINIRAGSNTRTLSAIDPKKQQLAQRAQFKAMETMYKRLDSGDLRWTITQFPCSAFAQEADMSLREFEDFVYGATFADQPDPVKCWQDIHDMQQRMVDWLKGKKRIEVHGPNAKLTLSIEGRTFINSDGRKNMPSGEIFTSPVEDSVNGWVNFSYPAIYGGREVEGVRLEFKEGRVVKATAKKNEEFLLSQLDLDANARIVGEWAIGTNYGIQRFSKSILFDEKIGGTMHLAVGRGFTEAGGTNVSILHWDFICGMQDDSEIRVDGDLFYKNGQFQI